jgi:hypothetical protein
MEKTMINQPTGAEAFPYPEITNDILDDITPKSEAIYVPSVSVGYAKGALMFNQLRQQGLPMPNLPANVLNFLDPTNPNFRLSHAMASYGQFRGKHGDTIFSPSKRDMARTCVIGDSGGYQWATNKINFSNQGEQLRALQWLEANCNIAMCLDAPTSRLGDKDCPFTDFRDCLDRTCQTLRLFENKRQNGGVKFLNVIHGSTAIEAERWYRTVRHYRFEGFAFGGPLRFDAYHLLRMLILMEKEGDLANVQWVHVLGTAQLSTAVILTAIQRAVKQHLGYNIRFSFDTSTPFRMLVANEAFGYPLLSEHELKVTQWPAPAGQFYRGKRLMWPWASKLGDIIELNDVYVQCGAGNTAQRDTLGNFLLALHNLQALCFAIRNVNRVFDVQVVVGPQASIKQVGYAEMTAIEGIDAVLRKPDLRNLQAHLHKFKAHHEKINDKKHSIMEADAEREFEEDWF